MKSNVNQWLTEFKVGSRITTKPVANCHHFDMDVYVRNLKQKNKTTFVGLLKRLFGLAVIVSMTLSMTSCSTTYVGSGRTIGVGGCGSWHPKKYSGKAPRQRGNAHMVSF